MGFTLNSTLVIVAHTVILILLEQNFYNETMLYLINCLRRERDRPAAFRAVGLYAIAVQGEIKRHLSQVMAVIKASLPTREALTKKSRGSNAHPVMDPSGKRIWHRPCFSCLSFSY